MRFLIEELGPRAFIFAKLFAQRDRARGGVGLVAGSGFYVAFEGGDLVGDRDAQLPFEPMNQQFGLGQLDCDLP